MRAFLSLLLIACSLFAAHTTARPRELATDTVPIPGPPPAPPKPPGDGAGAYNSSEPNWADRASKDKFVWAADEFGDDWPNARRHLRHYLANTGDDLFVDVDDLMDSVSSLDYGAKYRRVEWGQRTFRKIRGSTGIKMFAMPWEIIAPKMNTDWYYALGAFSYSVTGKVTKYSANNATLEYVVHIFDRYNWDGDKAVTINGIGIEDNELGNLHLKGLAREYIVRGRSRLHTLSDLTSRELPKPPKKSGSSRG